MGETEQDAAYFLKIFQDNYRAPVTGEFYAES
jgi:hypothetical protein